ncbi:MAG TPA: DUF1508 domain-containing protein [Allosphingosinicella sp.]|jgi:hypothetical protein
MACRFSGAYHELVASGEGYATRQTCERAINLLKGTDSATPVRVL